jgi:hypothetical protein
VHSALHLAKFAVTIYLSTLALYHGKRIETRELTKSLARVPAVMTSYRIGYDSHHEDIRRDDYEDAFHRTSVESIGTTTLSVRNNGVAAANRFSDDTAGYNMSYDENPSSYRFRDGSSTNDWEACLQSDPSSECKLPGRVIDEGFNSRNEDLCMDAGTIAYRYVPFNGTNQSRFRHDTFSNPGHETDQSKMRYKSNSKVGGVTTPGAFHQSTNTEMSNMKYQQKNTQLTYGTKTVEVSPGEHLRLRGADETWNAIRADSFVPCLCICCTSTLLCIDDAIFVLCPNCDAVSPIEGILSDVGYDGGVGLGFTMDELGKWQSLIEKERQGIH